MNRLCVRLLKYCNFSRICPNSHSKIISNLAKAYIYGLYVQVPYCIVLEQNLLVAFIERVDRVRYDKVGIFLFYLR
jgi:hypothetical protein